MNAPSCAIITQPLKISSEVELNTCPFFLSVVSCPWRLIYSKLLLSGVLLLCLSAAEEDSDFVSGKRGERVPKNRARQRGPPEPKRNEDCPDSEKVEAAFHVTHFQAY